MADISLLLDTDVLIEFFRGRARRSHADSLAMIAVPAIHWVARQRTHRLRSSHWVLRYDGATGTFIDAFVPPGPDGPVNPTGVTFGPDGNLYVANRTNQDVRR